MKNARPILTMNTGAAGSGTAIVVLFTGTDNPRHLRVIHALLRRPMPREQLDCEAGASNGPALVAELRARGLELPCHRVACYDCDGQEVWRGIYALTPRDRVRIARWLAERARRAA